MDIQERIDKAVELKHGRNNCAQAVAVSYSDLAKRDPEDLWTLTAGFGGGMGTMEGTCGALCGAVLIAGLLTKGERTGAVSRQVLNRFKELSGAVSCRDLKRRVDGRPVCQCDDCVRHAVIALAEAMNL